LAEPNNTRGYILLVSNNLLSVVHRESAASTCCGEYSVTHFAQWQVGTRRLHGEPWQVSRWQVTCKYGSGTGQPRVKASVAGRGRRHQGGCQARRCCCVWRVQPGAGRRWQRLVPQLPEPECVRPLVAPSMRCSAGPHRGIVCKPLTCSAVAAEPWHPLNFRNQAKCAPCCVPPLPLTCASTAPAQLSLPRMQSL